MLKKPRKVLQTYAFPFLYCTAAPELSLGKSQHGPSTHSINQSLPMVVGCCILELALRSFSDHISPGSLKISKQPICLGTTEKNPFLTKWQINNPLGYSLRYSQDITLEGNGPPINFASLGNYIQRTAQV